MMLKTDGGGTGKVLIFETHPIQYRAPVYKAIHDLRPGCMEVIYASDFSVRGYRDVAFDKNIAWDTPLLEGYPSRVLGNERGKGILEWSGLTGTGVDSLIASERPRAILLCSAGYAFNWTAYLSAVIRGIPIWIRTETQDEAFRRNPVKTFLRGLAYRMIYAHVEKAFYIGELNRQHLERHGLKAERLVAAHYCVADSISSWVEDRKARERASIRLAFGLSDEDLLVAFFGKLVSKKNPELLMEALAMSQNAKKGRIVCLIVGSGELESCLRSKANSLKRDHGIETIFRGFVNQTHLPALYLASDIVVLPSRRAGETWGLVVNEALHAGCSVAISDAVGCGADFGTWERVQMFREGNAAQLANAISELAAFPRDFNWAAELLRGYSVEAAAAAMALEMT